jgi:hypothetical protein
MDEEVRELVQARSVDLEDVVDPALLAAEGGSTALKLARRPEDRPRTGPTPRRRASEVARRPRESAARRDEGVRRGGRPPRGGGGARYGGSTGAWSPLKRGRRGSEGSAPEGMRQTLRGSAFTLGGFHVSLTVF